MDSNVANVSKWYLWMPNLNEIDTNTVISTLILSSQNVSRKKKLAAPLTLSDVNLRAQHEIKFNPRICQNM